MGFVDRRRAWVCGLVLLASCSKKTPPAPPPAARVENRRSEAELTTVHLAAEAEVRLAIHTMKVGEREVPAERSFGADVTAPPGRAITMAAPVAGTVQAPSGRALATPGQAVQKGQLILELIPMAPVDRDLRAQAEQRAAAAAARLHALEIQATRAEQLLAGKAGSARAAEDAVAQRDLARAEASAAQERLRLVTSSPLTSDVAIGLRAPRAGVLRQLQVAPGQTVGVGAPLFELVDSSHLWIRVPVFVDDLRSIATDAPARLHVLGAVGSGQEQLARPIAAPPSADLAAATVDLYYELDNPGEVLRAGQRVGVTLQLVGARKISAVPWTSIVYDFDGGAWIYERIRPHTYTRRRVAVDRVADGWAALLRGPEAGAEVVIQGASELFGVEFGAGR